MPPRKHAAAPELSRLKVLAAADPAAFRDYAIELLTSGGRLAREAALSALVERPLPEARPALRSLYFALDRDGLKLDQGALQRVPIVRVLTALGDTRDADVAARAASTVEVAMGEDISWQLRVLGLRLLADVAPDLFPYLAVEHLDDYGGIDGEPANTAFQLLAGTEHYLPIYQWLISGERDPALVAPAFELLGGAPQVVVQRYVTRTMEAAIRRKHEPLCTALAEAIVQREIEDAYPALSELMFAKLSDELYNYLAVLLAGTNRAPLLAILEDQLHRGRYQKAVEAALRIRTTPEQAAILRRWEE
jgi:hypothetical protein